MLQREAITCTEAPKLTEHCLKVIERLIEKLIHDIVEVSDMQFGFMPGRGTSDVIFIVQYVSYKNISGKRKKPLCCLH